MNLNSQGSQEISVAGSLLAARLGEALISKGHLSKEEGALIIKAAIADALGPQGWAVGPKAASIIEDVGQIWDRAKG